MDDPTSFVRYAKHTPKIQRQQVLCELVKQYTSADGSRTRKSADSSRPSIQRFHGALLFVDIAGFTALSQKLDVETLKNCINDYFSKMLDIVEKWEGDVVKFAGDALYILWPTFASLSTNEVLPEPLSREDFARAAQHQLEKAVSCGLEISAACSQYEIFVEAPRSTTDSPGIVSRLLPALGFSSNKISPSPMNDAQACDPSALYLDVHAGVSAGMMAGIDISYHSRAEFFLIGDPLVGVSMAESQAGAGDVVMCPFSHDLLHGKLLQQHQQPLCEPCISKDASSTCEDFSSSTSERQQRSPRPGGVPQSSDFHQELPCRCRKTTNGLFRVACSAPSPPQVVSRSPFARRRSSKALNIDFVNEQNNKIYSRLLCDIEHMLVTNKSEFRREFLDLLHTSTEENGLPSPVPSFPAIDSNSLGHAQDDESDEDRKFNSFLNGHLKQHFLPWISNGLMDVMVMHVHEVARSLHNFNADIVIRRKSIFADVMTDALKQVSLLLDLDSNADVKSDTRSVLDEPVSGRIKPKATRPSERKKSFEAVEDGEIRSVVVMFIKIERLDAQLLQDHLPTLAEGKNRFLYKDMAFLTRTDAEKHADEALLDRFQSCYEVLCGTLMEHGGQMRQFIVDDKGTVCIGTFGLRGSAAVDNAAIAVEAARRIIEGLSALDFSAAIGITSGKAYCGLVGSAVRHEYAVMGPSTNLSARLMCKAPANGIVCDLEIMEHDRTHKYQQLSAVHAKGYAEPVMTFKPMFDEVTPSSRKLNMHKNISHMPSSRFYIDRDMGDHGRLGMHPALERMIAAARSDFYLVETKIRGVGGSSSSGSGLGMVGGGAGTALSTAAAANQKLHGREAELMEIFSFLFSEDVEHPQHLAIQEKSKMVVVSGPSGSGKAALLLAIEKKLLSLGRADHRCNVLAYMYRANVLTRDIAFGASRTILTKMLRTVHRAIAAKEARPVRNFDAIRNSQDYGAMIDGLWPKLPAEFQDKKSALALMIPLLGETPDDDCRSSYQWCVRIAAALVTVISKLLKKVIVIIIHDISMFDEWSFQFLHCVWKESRGAVVLTSFNVDDNTTNLPTYSDVDPHQPPEDTSLLPSVMQYFSRFQDDAHFRVMDLAPLSKEATLAMAKDSLEMLGVGAPNPKDLLEVFDVSGGKPLYVMELVRSMASRANLVEQQRKDEASYADASHTAPSPTTIQPRTSFHLGGSYRIEEAICLRLDKLHLSLQILLKAAAVACAYSGHFSLEMLQVMLAGNRFFAAEDTNTTPPAPSNIRSPVVARRKRSRPSFSNKLTSFSAPVDVASSTESLQLPFQSTELESTQQAVPSVMYSISEAVLELLLVENFLKTGAGQDGMLSPKDSDEVSVSKLRTLKLEFAIPMEQTVINGLIVDEQREYFHERIALFLHQNNLQSPSVAGLQEEGFRWEQAAVWTRAMVAYNKAATLQRHLDICGDAATSSSLSYPDTVLAAFQMFQYMQSEVMEVVSLDLDQFENIDRLLQFLLLDNKPHRASIYNHNPTKKALDAALAVLERDMHALVCAFRVHLQLAEYCIKRWQSKEEVAEALKTALVFAVAARWHQEDVRKFFEEMDAKASAPSGEDVSSPPLHLQSPALDDDLPYLPYRDVLSDEEVLVLISYTTFTSQLLQADDATHPLLSSPVHLEYFVQSDRDETRAIQVQLLSALQCLHNHRAGKALQLVEGVLSLYAQHPVETSQALVKTFGMDLLPVITAGLGQHLLLQADLEDGRRMWSTARQLLAGGSVHDGYSWLLGLAALAAPCHLIDGGCEELLQLLPPPPGQGSTSSPQSSPRGVSDRSAALSAAERSGLGPHLQHLLAVWLSLVASQRGGRSSLSSATAAVEELGKLEVLVDAEVTAPCAAFLQAQGCGLPRIYAESYCLVFGQLRDSQLDVRIINNLMPLLQLPREPAAAGYFNLMHVLVYLGTLAADSSGGVLVAVKERAEQMLHHRMATASQRGLFLAACTLAEAVLLLPLHASLREHYAAVSSQSRARISKRRKLSISRKQSPESAGVAMSGPSRGLAGPDVPGEDQAWMDLADLLLSRSPSRPVQ